MKCCRNIFQKKSWRRNGSPFSVRPGRAVGRSSWVSDPAWRAGERIEGSSDILLRRLLEKLRHPELASSASAFRTRSRFVGTGQRKLEIRKLPKVFFPVCTINSGQHVWAATGHGFPGVVGPIGNPMQEIAEEPINTLVTPPKTSMNCSWLI